MAKPIAKITVVCPHCRAEQQEPELAKSTFCRQCSQYFAITPSSLAGAAPPPAPAARPSLGAASPAGQAAVDGGGLRSKFEGLLSSKPKQRTARCFECHSAHEVNSSATSSTCKACGAYIDLQDYKINGSFSRNIKTRGAVYLGTKGDLSSSKVLCDQATLHGKMRGNLLCTGRVTVRVQGRLYGTVEAGELVIEKGSEVVFSRPVKTSGAEIYGHMSGQVACDGHVNIHKTGLLDGAVEATGFSVERGGFFQGELTINPRRQAVVEPEKAAVETVAARVPERASVVVDTPLLGGEQTPVLG